MADNANKIGHRNYAVVDLSSLSEEEKEAVNNSKKEYIGIVPCSFHVDEKSWSIDWLCVFFSQGYTMAYDRLGQVRFISKGFLKLDEVSLLNKGHTVDEIRALYKKLIFLERQNYDPWILK